MHYKEYLKLLEPPSPAARPEYPSPGTAVGAWLTFRELFYNPVKLIWFLHHCEMARVFKYLELCIGNIHDHFLCHGDVGDEVMSSNND